MKKYINNINTAQLIKIIYLFIIFLSISGLLHAQPPNNGDPDSAPIDGGLSLLIAGGVGYGVKKMRETNASRESGVRSQEKGSDNL